MSCRRWLARWRASMAAAEFSSHVIPTLACAAHGIYGCDAHEFVRLNMKTRHCISGCGRVVPSGLGWATRTIHSRRTTTPPPLAVMADKDPTSPTPLGLTLVVASRHREEERRSDPFMPDSCKI